MVSACWFSKATAPVECPRMAYPHQLLSSDCPRRTSGAQLSACSRPAVMTQLGRALERYYGPALAAELPPDMAELVARLEREPVKPRLVA